MYHPYDLYVIIRYNSFLVGGDCKICLLLFHKLGIHTHTYIYIYVYIYMYIYVYIYIIIPTDSYFSKGFKIPTSSCRNQGSPSRPRRLKEEQMAERAAKENVNRFAASHERISVGWTDELIVLKGLIMEVTKNLTSSCDVKKYWILMGINIRCYHAHQLILRDPYWHLRPLCRKGAGALALPDPPHRRTQWDDVSFYPPVMVG